MACKDLNKIIGEHRVYVRQWPASKALAMQMKLINKLGASVLPFILEEDKFADIVRLSHANEDVEEVVALVKEFVCCARIDDKEVNNITFDLVYNGDLSLIYKVFGMVCSVQYKDFFLQGLETNEE